MPEDQVTQDGNQGVTQNDTQSLGWRAGLPDTLKNHELFIPHKTVGDLGKVHIETVAKVKELEGKVANSIPRLSEKATDVEKAAYYKALGVPEKPELYEFVKGEGVEHDPVMVQWAQGVFHKLNLTKEQGGGIAKEWDAFLSAMTKAEIEEGKKALVDSEKNFKSEFKTPDEANGAVELVKRFSQKYLGKDFIQFCADVDVGEPLALMKVFYEIAKKSGDDFSPSSSTASTGTVKEGMIYDKTPQHQKK